MATATKKVITVKPRKTAKRRAAQPDVSIERIGPQKAKKYLANNVGYNRPMKARLVRRFASRMNNNEWLLSCDCIGFDRDGHMMNGQHRLAAVVASGQGQNFIVVRNLPPNTFEVTDVGQRRTGGDTLAIAGYKNYNNVAAVARLKLLWTRDQLSGSKSTSAGLRGQQAVENSDILELVKSDESIVEDTTWVTSSVQKHLKGLIPASEVAFLYHLYKNVDLERAQLFVNGLATGEGLERGDPVLLLRQILIKNALAVKKLTRVARLAYLIKAANLFMKGDRVKTLVWTPDMNFPRPHV